MARKKEKRICFPFLGVMSLGALDTGGNGDRPKIPYRTRHFSNNSLVVKTCTSATKMAFPPFLDQRSRNKGMLNVENSQNMDHRVGRRHIYIYIYIHGCGLVCRRKFCHFWRFFPNCIGKSGQKEMLRICPISLFTFLTKTTQKWPGTEVPSIFPKKDTGTSKKG